MKYVSDFNRRYSFKLICKLVSASTRYKIRNNYSTRYIIPTMNAISSAYTKS